MKTVIFGSRSLLPMMTEIEGALKLLTEDTTVVISGCAKGVDSQAIEYAEWEHLKLLKIPADWSKGKIAGILRNEEMCKIADQAVCFWDGKSPGTKDMLQRVMKRGIPFVMVRT